MIIASRGYQTDLMLARFDGEVIVRRQYVVARTAASPAFWWGNFVLFARAPLREDVDEWERIFAQEIGWVPGIKHRNFAWNAIDGATGETDAFTVRGYQLNQSLFLLATSVHRAPRSHSGVSIRPLHGDHDWRAALSNQHGALARDRDTPSFREFQACQLDRYRRMVGAGLGQWFGAFLGDKLVADMGLFVDGGIGRCQAVATAPSFRRQGICAAMVHEVCSFGLRHMKAREIFMMTALSSAAARVYRSVGFEDCEHVASLSFSTSSGAISVD
ncbi:MAG TPA: GNAT family N-acetyltransferase [Polyangiaceae bacterium]|nr:GNAT family N-acetyltransferase [Polyangiaceae bacterium]